MPYIKQEDRHILDPEINALVVKLRSQGQFDPGSINYSFTKILHAAWKLKPRYMNACILIGTVICVVLEFYRRVISKYEDQKIKENGDV